MTLITPRHGDSLNNPIKPTGLGGYIAMGVVRCGVVVRCGIVGSGVGIFKTFYEWSLPYKTGSFTCQLPSAARCGEQGASS